VTYSLRPQGASVKLTILHELDKPGSKLRKAFPTAGRWCSRA
jgi:hypothetical protein